MKVGRGASVMFGEILLKNFKKIRFIFSIQIVHFSSFQFATFNMGKPTAEK